MILKRKRTLPESCARLARAVETRSRLGAPIAWHEVIRQVPNSGPEELTAGLQELVPALDRVVIGNGGPLAQAAAGLIEAGADPFVALDVLVGRITRGLRDAVRFPELIGELPPPPTSARTSDELTRQAIAAAELQGIDADEARRIVQSWFTINDWIPGLLLPLQQKRVRLALPGREALTAATEPMVSFAEDGGWLLGLLQVLDDEQLIVAHRATGACYAVTISGIGDNFQLHTLLADTLIGDPAAGLIAGDPPDESWVAAATTSPEMDPATPVRGQFNLVAADGEWIWNEGRPADIPVVAGHRVIVLDPPPYERSWNYGRAYTLMPPEIRLDHILPPDEAATWLQHIKPAG